MALPKDRSPTAAGPMDTKKICSGLRKIKALPGVSQMRTDRNALKSGVFIIVTVCLIIAIIIGIQGAANFGVAKQVRTVSFALADDIGGLQAGDEVRVGGFKVGAVR